MNLSYRGISYQAEAHSAQLGEGETIGQYRGLPIRLGATEIAPDRAATLRYRGVSYLRAR